jgi:hypothetical protein
MAGSRPRCQIVKRSEGRSAVAAAAYRAAQTIECELYGETHDYSRKGGVLHSEIMAPENAPEWATDRAALWNAVENIETNKDGSVKAKAQLAREIIVPLAHELDFEANRAALREWVADSFVSRGMVADIAMHAPHRQGDHRNVHAHVMLTMREIAEEGFAAKKSTPTARSWNQKELLETSIDRWLDIQNRELERGGHEARADFSSFKSRGVDREPEFHMGTAATAMMRKGQSSRIHEAIEGIRQRNRDRAGSHAEALKLQMEIDRQRGRFEDWAAHRIGELESRQQLSMLDLLRDQERAQGELNEHLAKFYGPHLKTVEAELSAVEQRLGRRGFARLWRSMTGKNRADRDQLEKLKGTVTETYVRMQEQRDKLAEAQRAQREQVESRQAEFRQSMDEGIERARQRKEETLRGQQSDAALSSEKAAEHRKGVEATTQAAAVQSLADSARQAQQDQLSRAKNENTQTPDRGRDRGSGPEQER